MQMCSDSDPVSEQRSDAGHHVAQGALARFHTQSLNTPDSFIRYALNSDEKYSVVNTAPPESPAATQMDHLQSAVPVSLQSLESRGRICSRL